DHPSLGPRWLYCAGAPELLFTENDTNAERLWGRPNASPYVKDGIGRYVVEGRTDAVNPGRVGTKAAAYHRLTLGAGASASARFRLTNTPIPREAFGPEFETVFAQRQAEADEFYSTVIPTDHSDDARRVMRQAFAGLLWSKQFYHYDVKRWLQGDPAQPPPPPERWRGRNHEWLHLYNDDVISMPDTWEYPWYAAWDLAFHMLPLALELAKQDPAYEDVASKFFEHFVYIAHAMHTLDLWDEGDGFYYDVLRTDGGACRLKVRSMVGLIPLFAVETLEPEAVDKLQSFRRR